VVIALSMALYDHLPNNVHDNLFTPIESADFCSALYLCKNGIKAVDGNSKLKTQNDLNVKFTE